MTEVAYSKAVEIYDQYFRNQTPASFHPTYVQIDALRDVRLKPTYFIYQEQDSYFYHAFHSCPIPNSKFIDIQSPYGYGGAIMTSYDPGFRQNAWLAYENWCKDQGVLVEFIRFHPLVSHEHYFGDVLFNRKTIYINTQVVDLFQQYALQMRTKIRKAYKNGLTVKWTNLEGDYTSFIKIYYDTMSRVQAKEYYYFPNDYFVAAARWNSCKLAICTLDNEILSAVLFLESPYLLEHHLSGSTEKGRQLGAANLLTHEGGIYAKGQGIPYLHLGGGTDSNPDNSLLQYKSRFSKESSKSYLGKKVFFPDEYSGMKKAWEMEHQKTAEWILFYRN
jgi:hypothetical protein